MSEEQNPIRQVADARRGVRERIEANRDKLNEVYDEMTRLMQNNLIPSELLGLNIDPHSAAAGEAFQASTHGLQIWRQPVRVAAFRGEGGETVNVDIPFSCVWENASPGLKPFHYVGDTSPERVLDSALSLHSKCSLTGPYQREHQATIRAIEAAIQQAFVAGRDGATAVDNQGNGHPPFTHLWLLQLKRNVLRWDVVDGGLQEVESIVWHPVVQLGYEDRIRHEPSTAHDSVALTEEELSNIPVNRRHHWYKVVNVLELSRENTYAELHHHLGRGYARAVANDPTCVLEMANRHLRDHIRDNGGTITEDAHERAVTAATEEGIREGVQSAINTIRVVDADLAEKLATRMQGGSSDPSTEAASTTEEVQLF